MLERMCLLLAFVDQYWTDEELEMEYGTEQEFDEVSYGMEELVGAHEEWMNELNLGDEFDFDFIC